jgi:TIR domain
MGAGPYDRMLTTGLPKWLPALPQWLATIIRHVGRGILPISTLTVEGLVGDSQGADEREFFVSYTGADQASAEWIAWELEQTGYTTVLQAWDFVAGSNFADAMDRALKAARHLIAILSPAYLRSRFGKAEWLNAFWWGWQASNLRPSDYESLPNRPAGNAKCCPRWSG